MERYKNIAVKLRAEFEDLRNSAILDNIKKMDVLSRKHDLFITELLDEIERLRENDFDKTLLEIDDDEERGRCYRICNFGER